jgi:hypothetical protein
VEEDAVGGRGGVEADPMRRSARRRRCKRGGTQSRNGRVSGREIIVVRVRVKTPHT